MFRTTSLLILALSAAWCIGAESEIANAEDLYKQGLAAHARHLRQEAIAAYTEAIALDPNHACAHHNRGHCFRALGNTKAAKNDYLAAIAIVCPHISQSHHALAEILFAENDMENALSHADQSIGLARSERVATYVLRGRILVELGRPELAIGDFDEALALAPAHWAPWAHRAKASLLAGRVRPGCADLYRSHQHLARGSRVWFIVAFGWIHLLGFSGLVVLFPRFWRFICEKEAATMTRWRLYSPRVAEATLRFNVGRGLKVVLGAGLLAFFALTLYVVLAPLWMLP